MIAAFDAPPSCPGDPLLSARTGVSQVVSAQRERDGLAVVLARVKLEQVNPERILRQPDAGQLIGQVSSSGRAARRWRIAWPGDG
jgi:hypothetical protein